MYFCYRKRIYKTYSISPFMLTDFSVLFNRSFVHFGSP